MHSGQKIVIHCAGTLEDGYVFMDTWAGNNPLTVTIGSGQIPPSVERRLMDLGRGQRSVFTLPPSEAYGEYDPSLVFEVPADAIPNAQDLPVGGFIMVQTDQGHARLKVLAVEGGMVRFDQNHELAGRDITFEVELVSDGTETAIDLERSSKGCSCGALRKSLTGDTCCHSDHHR
ncbi:MAG: FKBP-type peptidyl-prolyl cis-trans isomerase [Eggerthellaceae bacterium]|nr:FKBP-type peptidyl-prolyl cis-trans isomerase [Eggerthellaceae bacterium]